MTEQKIKNVLLTGATGYVGGRLLKILENKNIHLRCLARVPSYLHEKTDPKTEIVEGDVLDKESILKALNGIDIAFYLIHSMSQNNGFQETDRIAASNFANCAKEAGVQRIIYLGGLGDSKADLSAHLKSRQEVGEILRNSGVDTIELRSSIVLGSGSLSFELIRSLTEKLPIMIMPLWVQKPTQPIGIEDLLNYLVSAMEIEFQGSEIFEVGGADRVSYHGLMKEYAKQRNLKRLMIPVPVLTPYISSLWLGLVTPLYARIGRKLIDSISHPTIVQNTKAENVFDVKPKSAAESIASALINEDREFAETHWSDALSASMHSGSKYGGSRIRSRIIDHRTTTIAANPDLAFLPILQIGGKNGWYAFNFLWRIRGLIDLLFGGVGMRRHRPAGRKIRAGDTIDFWRVEKIKVPEYLNLVAEMKLPGKAWLEFEILWDGHQSTIHQSAVFYPHGALGLLYWYGIYPLHALIFRGMIKNIGKKALELKENK